MQLRAERCRYMRKLKIVQAPVLKPRIESKHNAVHAKHAPQTIGLDGVIFGTGWGAAALRWNAGHIGSIAASPSGDKFGPAINRNGQERGAGAATRGSARAVAANMVCVCVCVLRLGTVIIVCPVQPVSTDDDTAGASPTILSVRFSTPIAMP